jgi:hypothetical protein
LLGTALGDSAVIDVHKIPKNVNCEDHKETPDKLLYKCPSVLNYPLRMMEGVTGDICFLSDLLRNEEDMRFPGYEI